MLGAWTRGIARLIGLLAAAWVVLLPSTSSASDAQLEPWKVATVPRLTLLGLDGAMVDLTAERGTLVIVHFFATWCEPCRDELSSLERLSAIYPARSLRILAIDVGEPGDRVRRFLERNAITVRYPILIDLDKQAMRAWQVEILPTSYVLDSSLCPLWKAAGALTWDLDPTRSMLDAEISAPERPPFRSSEESCLVKGGTQ